MDTKASTKLPQNTPKHYFLFDDNLITSTYVILVDDIWPFIMNA